MSAPATAAPEGMALAVRTKEAIPQRKQQKQHPKQSSNKTSVPAKSPKSKSKPKPQVPNSGGSKTEAINGVNGNSVTVPAGLIAAVPQKPTDGKKKKRKKSFPRSTGTATATGSGDIVEEKSESFATITPTTTPTWKLSPFLGGRYAELDPAFTKDEK